MKSYSVPVLLWKNDQEIVTGLVVECDLATANTAAVGESRSHVLQQLRDSLEWSARRSRDFEPDFHDAELRKMTVRIRPCYVSAGREFPCTEVLEVSVPYVRGRRQNGMFVCSVPQLEMMFQQLRESVLYQTAQEGIQRQLSSCDPRELSHLLSLHDAKLEHVVVRIKSRGKGSRRAFEPNLSALKQVAKPMGTSEYRKRFQPAWQRNVEPLRTALQDDGSLLLVGDRRIGKTTLLVAAVRSAERAVQENDQAEENDESAGQRYRHLFWHSSAARVVAGMQYLGEWQERCEEVIDDLKEIRGTLYVERLTDLLIRGGSAPEDSVAAYMASFMQSGDLRLIAEVTPTELETCRRLLPGFVDMFQIFNVEPLTNEEARKALNAVADQQTRDLKVAFDPREMDHVGRLHKRFYPYQPLPGLATDFVSSLFADAAKNGATSVDANDIINRFSHETGLPEQLLRDDIPMPAHELRETLALSVMGQPDAVSTVTSCISAFKAGLNDPGRPLATLLFAGPTGVGKTELAKATADLLFGSGHQKERLLRFDMSEYSSFSSAQRLLNASDGSSGRLISKVRQQPFQIILFDEIEKASPDVFDMLLGLFDEGRLTDRYGRTASFCTSIVIMTSNLGASTRAVGFGGQATVASDQRPEQFFRPEFFNRIDSVVTFHPLSRETSLGIIRRELKAIESREGIRKRGVEIEFSDNLTEHLLTQGFDAKFGARPLQRTIERVVVGPLSRYLLDYGDVCGKFSLSIDQEGELTIRG